MALALAAVVDISPESVYRLSFIVEIVVFVVDNNVER